MSNIQPIFRLITEIFNEIELTHLECSGDNSIAEDFTLHMSMYTFAGLRREKHSYNYIPLHRAEGEPYTLVGYPIKLHDSWDREKLVYLHYNVYECVDLSKEVPPSAYEVARTKKVENSRGVQFEW